MAYKIEYHCRIDRRGLAKLSVEERRRIQSAIEEKLVVAPDVFGKPLRQTLKGHRCLRVGDYRVIYKVKRNTVIILGIIHRSLGYGEVEEWVKY